MITWNNSSNDFGNYFGDYEYVIKSRKETQSDCFFDQIFEQQKNLPIEQRQNVWHLVCPCRKRSVWC